MHFFRQIVAVPAVDKEILSQCTADCQVWVEAFARNHRLPIEWAEKGMRKKDHVMPWQRLVDEFGFDPTGERCCLGAPPSRERSCHVFRHESRHGSLLTR